MVVVTDMRIAMARTRHAGRNALGGIADGTGGIRWQDGHSQAREDSVEELHRGLTVSRTVYRLYCGASLGESAYPAPLDSEIRRRFSGLAMRFLVHCRNISHYKK